MPPETGITPPKIEGADHTRFAAGEVSPAPPPREAECSEFRSAEMPEVRASEQGQTPTPPDGWLAS